MMSKTAILLALALAGLCCVSAQKPGTYQAAYHYLRCSASAIVVPENTAQLVGVIKEYYAKAKSGVPVTIRSSRPSFHSSATFPCPGPAQKSPAVTPAVTTEAGPRKATGAAPITVAVHHQKLNKVIAKNPMGPYTLTVGAGMDLNELTAAATKNGMSVQIGSLCAYAGLTVGGILATSAHGSGDQTVSMMVDTVLAVKLIDGMGNVKVIKKTDPDFKLINGGLGLIGIITEITLQMTPPSNTQLITLEKRSDTNLATDIPKMLEIGKHILIFWRPDIKQYIAYITREAPKDIKPNPKAYMSLLPNLKGRPNVSLLMRDLQTLLPDDIEAIELVCDVSQEQNLAFSWASVGPNEPRGNITGYTNRMQASECDVHCLWNDMNVTGGATQDVEFTADYDQLPGWISDVKKIFQKDLWEDGKKSYRCPGPGYLWIRFGRGDDAYLSTMHGIKRPVYLQSTWLRSRKAFDYPIKYQFVMDLIEEMTLCKYNARPHWGKNFDRTFTYAKCPIRPKYKNFGAALSTIAKYDPLKMYTPSLFAKVASGTPYTPFPRCTLTQACYCTKDIHCHKDMKCVPSLSFPEYKVCKFFGPPAKNGTINLDPLFNAADAVLSGPAMG